MTPEQFSKARTALGLTQQELADIFGVYQVTVARWETGVSPIDNRTQMALEHLHCARRATAKKKGAKR